MICQRVYRSRQSLGIQHQEIHTSSKILKKLPTENNNCTPISPTFLSLKYIYIYIIIIKFTIESSSLHILRILSSQIYPYSQNIFLVVDILIFHEYIRIIIIIMHDFFKHDTYIMYGQLVYIIAY